MFVSLRMAASAIAPWSPMLLFQSLQGVGAVYERAGACQRALTRKRAGGALERSRGAPLEPLAEHRDALGGVGTLDIAIFIKVVAAKHVVGQAATSTGMEECQWALTRSEELGRRRTRARSQRSP